MNLEKSFFVYIITNKPYGILYTGMTENLSRRMFEHKNGLIEGFSRDHELKILIYYEIHSTHDDAFTRERRIKKWRRDWKKQLIEKMNPAWNDLSDQII